MILAPIGKGTKKLSDVDYYIPFPLLDKRKRNIFLISPVLHERAEKSTLHVTKSTEIKPNRCK